MQNADALIADSPSSEASVDLLARARELAGAGKFSAAEALLARLAPDAAARPEVLQLRGMIGCCLGNFERAAQWARAAIALRPGSAELHYLLGRALAGTGDPDAAATAYTDALRFNPDYANALVSLGVVHRQREQLREAVDCFRRAVLKAPAMAEAYYNLGDVLLRLEHADAAAEALRAAVELAPALAEAWLRLGAALDAAGKASEATACYQRVSAQKPQLADALYSEGAERMRSGDLAGAYQQLRAAALIKPERAGVLVELGEAFRTAGKKQAALDAFATAAEAAPSLAEVHNGLAVAQRDLGRFRDAEVSFERALALDPRAARTWSNFGAFLVERVDLDRALEVCTRAVALDPLLASAHSNLGLALKGKARYDEALASFERALELNGRDVAALNNVALEYHERGNDTGAEARLREALGTSSRPCAETLLNLGTVCYDQGRFEEALDFFNRAVATDPDSSEAHGNLGIALNALRRPMESLPHFERAVELKIENHGARLNRALALLLAGDLARGWEAYEWRWHAIEALKPHLYRFDEPRWRGEPIAGRTLLLHAEQGLGDTLQFARYVPLVAARGARVVLECPASLVRLLASLDGIHRLVPTGDLLPKFDIQSSLMSLPFAFGTTLESIPAKTPYLRVPKVLAEAWANRVGRAPGYKVGLVWSGDPRKGDRHANTTDQRRSFPLSTLAPLGDVSGVRFFSLQKGEPARQAPPDRLALEDFMGEVGDFADTAALICNLDLVITVDTSVAHLAGAIGCPVWLLSRADGCWRWLLDREDSPWYPTLRVFRQREPMRWQPVIEAVANELAQRVASYVPRRDWQRAALCN